MDIFGRCENADPQDIEDWKNHMDSRYKAQRDRLREALEKIESMDTLLGHKMKEIARAALAEMEGGS